MIKWNGAAVLIYLLMLIYCKVRFGAYFFKIIISFLLYIIVLSSIQFVSAVFVSMFILDNEIARNAVGNILVLAFCFGILPKCKLHKLQEGISKKSKYVMILLGFMSLIIILMLFQGKIFYRIQLEYFILAVPAIFILLYSIVKWYSVKIEVEKMEEKMQTVEENEEAYNKLLVNVRMYQHELKNHITAIFSARYTYDTYEKLVQAQEKYCEELLNENRYNELLFLGNGILSGFLYGKFQQAEEDGIEIQYKIMTKVSGSNVPVFYIIEMLGILFDNSIEALKNVTENMIENKIIFEVKEIEGKYQFAIMNPCEYVSYERILEWFSLEKSEKGIGRGLGLYHLKELCKEWNCDICCQNVEISHGNWIEFTLKIGKEVQCEKGERKET